MQDLTAEELEVLCDLQIDDIFRDDEIPSVNGSGSNHQEIPEPRTSPGFILPDENGEIAAVPPVTLDIPPVDSVDPILLPISAVSPQGSSASSDSWSTTNSTVTVKRSKRKCIPCNLTFKHHCDFYEHHQKHVSMPILKIKKLTQREIEFQEYLKKGKQVFLCARKKTFPRKPVNPTVSTTDGDGLKLRFKFHNFNPDSSSHSDEATSDGDAQLNGIREEFRKKVFEERHQEKILKASEIKQSPPGSPNTRVRELIPIPELSDLMPPDRIHFECPTLDGLDQFNSEASREDASDILKNLLEFNQQPLMEPDWNGQPANEFISIEKLGHICRVCHMNFTDPVLLFQHQRQTGHDMPPQGPPMSSHGPNQGFPMSQHGPMPRIPTSQLHYRPHDPMGGNFPGQRMHPPPQHMREAGHPGGIAALRLQQLRNGQFRPVLPVQFGNMRSRHPPPLYRMANSPGMPSNVPHQQPQFNQQQQRPQMGPQGANYRFAVNNGMIMNGGSLLETNFNQGQMMPESSQMQPQMHGMSPMFRSVRPGMPQRRPSLAPIGIRPNLGQFQPPPAKKLRPDGDGPMISMPPRADGVPVIQSVQSGPSVTLPENPGKTSPLPSGQKSPKAVANILANRGITVTQGDFTKLKPDMSGPEKAAEGQSKDKVPDDTDSVVQKLALNSSVSIISKKKSLMTIDVSEEDAAGQQTSVKSEPTPIPKTCPPLLKPRHTPFLSCPDTNCQKKFLTEEALSRHTQKGHHSNIRYKCRQCAVMFSSSESLIIHQRRVHRIARLPSNTNEELGIPIIDLNNSNTRLKLLSMGIKTFIPLGNINRASTGFFGLPIVNIRTGSAAPSNFNLQNIGAESVFSLGSAKSIVPK
ncbi:uncharacterized protein DMENIID0001_061140 [Sergentomyia squamirostris]